LPGWDSGYGSSLDDQLAKIISIIGLVCNDIVTFITSNQGFGLSDVMALSSGELKA
jgi:hypothetical protein